MLASFANRRISLHVYPSRLSFIAEGQQIAEHTRVFTTSHDMPGKVIYDWQHYLLVAQRKPGALRNGAPFNSMPDSFKHLQSILLQRERGDKEMVEVLSLILHHDEADVLRAVEMALEAGCPSKQHVMNCLSRIIMPLPPAPIPIVSGLQLAIEPTSDTSRYDTLRGKRHAH